MVRIKDFINSLKTWKNNIDYLINYSNFTWPNCYRMYISEHHFVFRNLISTNESAIIFKNPAILNLVVLLYKLLLSMYYWWSVLQGAFNKFPDFFVQAFKIVIDSWKFSMLLLYILWDDWPIFMILGSNEQLQQELENTLLKPDCHSWWISKMQSGRENTLEERYAIKLCFKLGKNATEMYGMLLTAFEASCMNRTSDFEWHKRFKEGRESVRDDERCGRSKEVRTPELIGQIKNFMDKDRQVSFKTISAVWCLCGNCTHNY